MRNKSGLLVKDIAVIGMMATLLEVVKTALNAVPNLELVTLCIILFTNFLGWKSAIAVFVFIGLECAVWGINLWTVMYLYVWPILVGLTMLLRSINALNRWSSAFLAGGYGIMFGAMCALPYLFIKNGGVATAFAWWVAGIPYDIMHGICNFLICLFLFEPLNRALKRLKRNIYEE